MKKEFENIQSQIIETAGEVFNDNMSEIVDHVRENARDLNIMPINKYVLVKPYSINPYVKVEMSEEGIAMNTKEHKIFNQDKGEVETADNWERVGTIVEVSPTCEFVKVGDDIFYRKGQAVPISFLHLGLEVVAENQILVIINESLKERFNN